MDAPPAGGGAAGTPSLSPLSGPWPRTPPRPAQGGVAAAEGPRRGPGPWLCWRTAGRAALRGPNAGPAHASEEMRAGCAAFALGVLAGPWRAAGGPGGDGHRRPEQSRPLLLRRGPTRRLSDRQLGAAGRMPVRSLFSGRGTSVSWVQTCGPELCSLFSAETWAQSGVQGTSPPPSSWRVCRQRPRGHSRCTRKTCLQFWSCQYFSGKRQERRSLLLDGGGVFTYFSRPRTGPDW